MYHYYEKTVHPMVWFIGFVALYPMMNYVFDFQIAIQSIVLILVSSLFYRVMKRKRQTYRFMISKNGIHFFENKQETSAPFHYINHVTFLGNQKMLIEFLYQKHIIEKIISFTEQTDLSDIQERLYLSGVKIKYKSKYRNVS